MKSLFALLILAAALFVGACNSTPADQLRPTVAPVTSPETSPATSPEIEPRGQPVGLTRSFDTRRDVPSRGRLFFVPG